MLESVLVATRGEMAVRIARSCRDLGLRTVAVCSEIERDAAHAATGEVRTLPGDPAAAYGSIEAIVDAALAAKVEAVHPGCGHLSESAELAEAVLAAGLVFVGPAPDALRAFGDKDRTRALARQAGVPVLPGRALRGGPSDADDVRTVGFPCLLKAVHGGGGRGSRLVADPDELPAALAGAAREAQALFGDPALLAERYLPRARHIEVQVLADRRGSVTDLGTRDCTLQRRRQKVLEEAPAPGLGERLLMRMREEARAVTAAAGLVGVATVEFLLDTDSEADAHYLIEVNPRLQVEHPVTELITGVDLVAAQLRLASGELVPDPPPARGHAVEVRVNAEAPSRDFAPSPGVIGHLELPAGPWTRCDFGVRPGDVVTPYYDPLLGKVITWGPDRSSAIARMCRALDELSVAGVDTTAAFAAALLGDDRVTRLAHWTAMIDEGQVEDLQQAQPGHQPPVSRDPDHLVRIRTTRGDIEVRLPGGPPGDALVPEPGNDPGAVPAPGTYRDGGLLAPMTGTLVTYEVAVGDRVTSGMVVARLESMKLEMPVRADRCGVVTELRFQPGDTVPGHAELLAIS